MAETKRVPRPADAALDTAGDHMAEMLRRTDELLAEWSRFGAAVRTQVEREAANIGNVVGNAVESAVHRATANGVDRAFADQLGARLAALSAEISKVETRARNASRAISDERRGDRTMLYGLGLALLIANGLLVALLLRQPSAPAIAEPVPVVAPPAPALEVAPPAPEPKKEEAPAVKADADPKPDPEAKPEVKPDAKAKPVADEKLPAHKGVKLGPPTGRAKPLAVPPMRKQ